MAAERAVKKKPKKEEEKKALEKEIDFMSRTGKWGKPEIEGF